MSNSTRFYVYLHRFKNGTLYVGKGCGRRAWQSSANRHNSYWDRLRNKYGAPKVRVIFDRLLESDALSKEVLIISLLRAKQKTLCNRTDGGDGCVGMDVGTETRKKIGAANRGEKNNMWGKNQPQYVKDAISAANTGRFVGELSGRYDNEVFIFLDDINGDTFIGTKWEFQQKIGISAGWISRLCSGNCDSARGWRLSTTLQSETGRRGKRHGRYDHRVFSFVHDSGIKETCTKNELGIKYHLPSPSNLSTLCAGRIKSYKGWRLPL